MTKASILVVEDEQIVALDIKSQLMFHGYDVPATTARGEDAIRLAKELRPDLILMDINIKGDLDGIEVARHIRSQHDIPVIFVTAYDDEDTLQRAKVTESYGYLLKPLDERALRTTIEIALYKHEMERKLRESEQWLTAVLNGIGDAVIATDAQGCVKSMNPVAQKLTGWDEKEALGQRLSQVLPLVHSQTRCPVADPVASVLSKEEAIELSDSTLLVARDGRETMIKDSAVPIRDQMGNISGIVLVFRDVTDQVRTRETMEQYAAELEAKNAELDAFAHTAAHDIKDPLSTMIGYASLMSDENNELEDEQHREFSEIIATYGLKLSAIVDELLMLSSIRNSEVERESLDMGDIVTSAEERLIPSIQARGAEIVWSGAWPAAQGYGPWIEEVWVNYLSNGIKYGGHPPRLELGGTAQPDGMVRFWVRDNGPGIAAEDQDRLFVPFARLHQAQADGHGLGLSIVRRIVEKLGGQASVESRVGEGSTFAFTLPGIE